VFTPKDRTKHSTACSKIKKQHHRRQNNSPIPIASFLRFTPASALTQMNNMALLVLASFFLTITTSMAFIPLSTLKHGVSTHGNRMMVDPSVVDSGVANFIMQQSSVQAGDMVSALQSSSVNLAFSDQGQNLAGIFFQASLLPYLAFLYFLSFRANRINNIGNFGFQFILLFVASTIPAGIVSKLTYGTSLANVDWLHGGAELLLTVANVLIVRRTAAIGSSSCLHLFLN
jgi:hypothetical protein